MYAYMLYQIKTEIRIISSFTTKFLFPLLPKKFNSLNSHEFQILLHF